MKSLVSYWLEVTVYERVLIPLNTVRTNVTSQKTGIIIIGRLFQDTAKAEMRKEKGIQMLLDAILPLPITSK